MDGGSSKLDSVEIRMFGIIKVKISLIVNALHHLDVAGWCSRAMASMMDLFDQKANLYGFIEVERWVLMCNITGLSKHIVIIVVSTVVIIEAGCR